jgi:xanthine dehydrogenase large subunit
MLPLAAVCCCAADGKVEYVGQLIALVAATSQTAADRAAKHVTVHYADIPGETPIITLEQAIAAGSFYEDQAAALKVEAVRHNQSTSTAAPTADDQESVTISSSSSDGAYQATGGPTPPPAAAAGPSSVCDLISAAPLRLRGCYSLPAQQHMYMETQTAVAEPGEDGAVKVWSATQSLDAVQQAVAAVLGVSFNQVAVITRRLGGG